MIKASVSRSVATWDELYAAIRVAAVNGEPTEIVLTDNISTPNPNGVGIVDCGGVVSLLASHSGITFSIDDGTTLSDLAVIGGSLNVGRVGTVTPALIYPSLIPGASIGRLAVVDGGSLAGNGAVQVGSNNPTDLTVVINGGAIAGSPLFTCLYGGSVTMLARSCKSPLSSGLVAGSPVFNLDYDATVGTAVFTLGGGFTGTFVATACDLDVLQVLDSGVTGARPTATQVGQRYFDTTLGIPIWWSGSNWVDATGATV